MFAIIGSGKALFLANNGKRYVPGKLSDMACQYVKLAGFDRTGACHLYRHNTATTMLDNGHPRDARPCQHTHHTVIHSCKP